MPVAPLLRQISSTRSKPTSHSASEPCTWDGHDRHSFDLDTDALGYDRADVHWFSYAEDGGAYGKDDTHRSLYESAGLLAAQLRAQQAREPGREVDLIAHSQGGVVVDVFLKLIYKPSDP